MGSKISCSTCNPKPTTTTTARGEYSSSNANQRVRDAIAHRTRGATADGHVLRLWAEVFHVSASSGAVRWTQLSDDLVPITVTQVQQRYHVTAYNSRVDKVLDVWLSATRLGQASNCFVYWKDAITGDTWGLNFTSAADARAFRECISAARDFRRAESSYSLSQRGGRGVAGEGRGDGEKGSDRTHARQHSSQPNSPQKQKYLREMQTTAASLQNTNATQNQCTCDCMTSDVLHKQRNGRIRYSNYQNFTRQDSGGTTQSSKSDGSLVRRQERQQQYLARGHVRSMEDQIRRSRETTQSLRNAKEDAKQRRQEDDRQQTSSLTTGRTTTSATHLKSKSIEDLSRKTATTATTTDDLMNDRMTTTTASTLSSEQIKKMLRDVNTSAVTDLSDRRHDATTQRPKSLSEVTQSSSSMLCDSFDSFDRSRSHRSLEGRRRSLEKQTCVDFTDASPPTPARATQQRQQRPEQQMTIDLDSESEILKCLASQSSRDDAMDVISQSLKDEYIQYLLKESIDDVAVLMREVQQELSAIRAEEKQYAKQRSLSTQSLLQLSRSSAPILDTLSIDGQLPFCSSNALNAQHHYNARRLLSASQSALSSQASREFSALESLQSLMTSSEVSDDEKASLTTAISDDDDLESPLRARSGSSAANFECLGSVRKSGFLSVKKWLLRKRHSLELARKRGWKGYWVCLKGTTLLFYNCESRDGHAIDSQPKHLIFVDSCLVQSIPEHPKRDHVFCLSTAFGDAYLLDAPCLEERDSWIAAIHCACASQMARSSGKVAVGHLLGEEVARLERQVELDSRSRHETELLLSCISDEKQKQSLVNAIMALEEKVEKTRTEAFRLKCYSASLTSDEMPNPKTILSLTNRRTKSQLNRLGVFTVSSLHAFNCAKNPSIVSNLLKRQKSSEERETTATSVTPIITADDKLMDIDVAFQTTGERRRLQASQSWTVNELLIHVMSSHLNAREYYASQSSRVLSRNDLLSSLVISDATQTSIPLIEVIPKQLFTLELIRDSNDVLFGFSVESELILNDLCVFVSRVEHQSIAYSHSLKRFDELVVINGALVSDLDMMFVESILQEELTLCLMIRSSSGASDIGQHQHQSQSHSMMSTSDHVSDMNAAQTTDELIEALVCPPPPPIDQNNQILSDCQLDSLIVPKVESFLPKSSTNQSSTLPNTSTSAPPLSSSQLIHFNSQPKSAPIGGFESGGGGGGGAQLNAQPMLATDKMRKVVKELIDTEITYCAALEQLLDLYLEPLSQSSLLSEQDIKVLFGSIVSIIKCQKEFKSELQSIAGFDGGQQLTIDELNVEAIANCFLAHSTNFRAYSSFCASHSRLSKLLSDEKVKELQEWLSRRSSGQLAQSLESFLIKPIQRVLKYPLLLSQMKTFCIKDSKEYQKLNEALKAMEKVAEHINEMQRIHEEYGAIFEHLARNYNRNNGLQSNPIDLSPTALIHYGGVEWINSIEFLGKNCRKGVELHSMCFVFNCFVVFLCKETIRHRKGGKGGAGGAYGSGAHGLRSADVEIIRHQTLIPVIEVQVRACGQQSEESGSRESRESGDFKWELIQLKTNAGKRSEKIYRLSNSTCEYRNAFLRTIRQIIREDVRQMSVLGLKAGLKPAPHDSGASHSSSTTSGGQHNKENVNAMHKSLDNNAVQQQMVACGLCGKDVSIGCRERHSSANTSANTNSNESPIWKRRQDSNSSSR